MFNFFKPLILGPDCKISHTKLWSNIGSAAATFVFIKQGIAGTLTEGVWYAYLAGICGAAAVSKMLALKYQTQPPEVQPEGLTK